MSTNLPSALARSSYGSPLRRPLVGCGLLVVLALLTSCGLLLAATVFINDKPGVTGVLLTALAATFVLSLPVFIGLRWLDRREPEPLWLAALAFAWGGLIATGYSLLFNELTDAVVGSTIGTIVGAPFFEETFKTAGLVLIFLLLRDEFDNARDGIVYGGLVGAGFNFLEAALYIANGYAESGVAPFGLQLVVRFVFLGFNGHAVYSALAGLGLGIARQTNSQFWRYGAPLLGFLGAIVTHMLWNSVGALSQAFIAIFVALPFTPGLSVALENDTFTPEMLPLAATWFGVAVAKLLIGWPAVLAIIIALVRNSRWELRVMREQLAPEVGGPVVTANEYLAIQQGSIPPASQPAARRIFNHQAELALRKWHVARDGRDPETDPVVAAWRADLVTLREPMT